MTSSKHTASSDDIVIVVGGRFADVTIGEMRRDDDDTAPRYTMAEPPRQRSPKPEDTRPIAPLRKRKKRLAKIKARKRR